MSKQQYLVLAVSLAVMTAIATLTGIYLVRQHQIAKRRAADTAIVRALMQQEIDKAEKHNQYSNGTVH